MTARPIKSFTVGGWLVEPDLDRIRDGDTVRGLRPQVTELLLYLAQRPGEVVSAESLFEELWAGKIVTSGSLYNCVAELRQALHTEADAPPAIQTVPKRGYRLVAPVGGLIETDDGPLPVGENEATDRDRQRTTVFKRPLHAVLAGLVVIVVALAFVARDRARFAPEASASSVRSIAVLPLLNLTGNEEKDYFADGMTEALTATLGQIPELKVISRTTAMQYRGTSKRLPDIARELNVDALIEGSVLWVDNDVRITLQLIHGETDHHLWSSSYRSSLRDVLSLQHDVASAIAQRIELGFNEEAGPSDEKTATTREANVPSADAVQAYLKGRYHFNRVGLSVHDALQYYQQAIEIDPEFALAHAAFAEACWQPPIVMSGTLPFSRCREAADRALELDADLAEAQAGVGFIRVLQWDWDAAEKHFERALAINPNSSMVNRAYAELLRTTMRAEEALVVMRRAEQLDPLNLFVKTMVGWPLYNLHRYGEAIEQWDHVLEVDSGFWLAHYNRGLAFIELGRPQDVLDAAVQAGAGNGADPIAVSMLTIAGHALRGDVSRAQEMLSQAERNLGVRHAGWIAANYVLLDNGEQALRWLERGVAERVIGVAHHTSEPIFDPLREHPMFRSLRAAMGLP
ncbi:MAG: winged helix-turn-helix domain-containing tetratricopeptide repeat protein [Woeseiaceae bacterium]